MQSRKTCFSLAFSINCSFKYSTETNSAHYCVSKQNISSYILFPTHPSFHILLTCISNCEEMISASLPYCPALQKQQATQTLALTHKRSFSSAVSTLMQLNHCALSYISASFRFQLVAFKYSQNYFCMQTKTHLKDFVFPYSPPSDTASEH